MTMGRRPKERQREFWIAADEAPSGPKHAFYDLLETLLREAGFDAFVERLCEPFYEKAGPGRPSLPPGRYFRMLLIGYFEGIESQRGIAWRCCDSLSLRRFLFLGPAESSPDHSTLSLTRDRLPLDVHQRVFEFVLQLAREKKLLKDGPLTVGVDSTLLEANAAMKSIVQWETGENWNDYLTRLMREAGRIGPDDAPSADELRRFDESRTDKSTSNREWASPTDPGARIAKMKDGTTHLAYKAEHVVDLESEILLSAEILTATASDPHTLVPSVAAAQAHLAQSGSTAFITEVAADKGYHANETLADCQAAGLMTYIPQRQARLVKSKSRKHKGRLVKARRRWDNKPAAMRRAFEANRRRMRGPYGRKLQRLRSERVERSFAHVCETGGHRRTWLRWHPDHDLDKIKKRYAIVTAGRNLGLVMRHLFGIGKPRGLQGASRELLAALWAFFAALAARWTPPKPLWSPENPRHPLPPRRPARLGNDRRLAG